MSKLAWRRLEFELHFLAQLLVQCAQRFVHEDDCRIVDQAAGDGDALLLAARQFARLPPGDFRKAHQFKHLGNLGLDHARLELSNPERKGNVLEHGHVGHQRVVLKNHAQSPLVGRHLGNVLAVDPDATGRRPDHAGNQVEDRRLP